MTKVLIFEPDHAFAVELRTQLTQLGCTVQVFKEGNTGLIAASTQPPDIILLSVELPRVNGFSICNKIKKDASLAAIPLLILSSSSSPETFEQHQRLPTRAEDYIHKPVAFADLLAHMQQFAPIGRPPERYEISDEPTSQVGEDDLEFLEEQEEPAPPTSDYHTARMQAVRNPSESDVDIPVALDDLQQQTDEVQPSTTRRQTAFSHPAVPAHVPPPPPSQPSRPIALASPMPPPVPPASSPGALLGTTLSMEVPPVTEPNPEPFIPEYGLDADDGEYERTHLRTETAVAHAVEVATEAMNYEPPPGTPVPPGPGVPPTPVALQTDLANTKRALQHALRELSAAKRAAATAPRLSDDNQRLRKELEDARSKMMAAGESSTSSSRESLDLREQLQKKDREIIDLHEKMAAKEREVLEARDATLGAERRNADLTDTLNEHQREIAEQRESLATSETTLADAQIAHQQELAEWQKRVEALEADKELSEKRAQDFKAGARKIADQLNDRTQELRDAVDAHRAEVVALGKQHAEALKQHDDKHRAELSLVEGSHQEQLQRARDEAAATAAEQKQTIDELSNTRNELAQAKKSLIDDLDNAERALAAQTKLHEAAQVEAKAGYERMLDEAHQAEQKKTAAAKDAAKEEHERALTDLHAEQAEALQQAGYEMQEKLLEKDESFKAIKEQLDNDLLEAGREADTLREHIAVLEKEVEQERVASGNAQQLQEHIALTEARVVELDTEVAAQKNLLAEEQARAGELDEQVSALTEERDDMKSQLDALGEQLLDLDKQLATERGRLAKARTRWGNDRQALAQARDALSKVVGQLQTAADEELD